MNDTYEADLSSDSPRMNSTNESTGGMNGYERNEDLAKVEIAILSTIFVLTVIGNSIVPFAIFLKRKKMSRMYYFILHLSIADLITAFFNVLTQLCWELTYRFVGGNFMCKFIKYMQILGPYLSSYVLVMTAIDRYQAICYPLSNCSWTPKRSKVMIGISWVISLLLCVPQTFIFSFMEVTDGVYDCWATFIEPWGTRAYVTWYALTVFIIPLVVLVFAYSCICRAIWVNFNLKVDKDRPNNVRVTTDNPPKWRWCPCVKPRREKKRFYWCASDRFSSSSSSSNCTQERLYPERQHASSDSHTKYYNFTNHNNCRETLLRPGVRVTVSGSNGAVPHAEGEKRKSSGKLSVLIGLHHDSRSSYSPNQSSSSPREKVYNPRTHSVKGISRAKIKTVKLTVVVILCYIVCSSPFIAAQLWATWDPLATQSPFWSGATFTILTLLASLNSCVNPWIYLAFNPNLLLHLFRTFRCPRRPEDSPCRLDRGPTFRSSSLSDSRYPNNSRSRARYQLASALSYVTHGGSVRHKTVLNARTNRSASIRSTRSMTVAVDTDNKNGSNGLLSPGVDCAEKMELQCWTPQLSPPSPQSDSVLGAPLMEQVSPK